MDYVTKFSVGNETREDIVYQPGVSANVPKNSKFSTPVQGLNFTLNYSFTEALSAGVGSGFNFVQLERHPVAGGECMDKTFIPVYSRFSHNWNFNSGILFLSNINAGYQFYNFRFSNSENGFRYKDTGGLLLNFNIGVGKTIGKFTPFLKVGYEFNQFSHEMSLDWIGDPSLTYEDKIKYKTNYHLINLSLSLRM